MTMQRHAFNGHRRPLPAPPQRHPALPALKTAGQMPEQGTVKFYDRARGFGFIERAGGFDVFVHSSVAAQYGLNDRMLEKGTPVKFSMNVGPRGPAVDAIALA